jgi:4'-phosphopantetheinyl transferase
LSERQHGVESRDYTLINNAIDLWIEELSVRDDEYQFYWSLLDANEQTKAMRFIQEKHRKQYVISHGKLRTILASYMDIAPEKIPFAVEASGKPYSIADGRPHEIKFNLSHSENKMVVAVGYYENMGVDIEVWDSKVDFLAVANECFAEAEKSYWQALPIDEKTATFYQLWTRKESFAKAVGSGITLGVAQVVTSLNGTACFLSIPDSYGSACDWTVVDLDVGLGISGALTVGAHYKAQGEILEVNSLSLEPSGLKR